MDQRDAEARNQTQREVRRRRILATLWNGFLVILVGLVWGLTPALARMASGVGANPLGLAVWVNAVAAIFCFSIAACRGRTARLTRDEFLFFLQWAIIAGVLQRLTIFAVTSRVEATMLSLIVTLEGLMVFVFSAAMNLEKATSKRLLGVLVCLGGAAIAIVARKQPLDEGVSGWLFIALLVPFFFAVQGVLIATRRPRHVDIFAGVGIMMALSTIILFPIAHFSGQLVTLGPSIDKLVFLVVLIGIGVATSILLVFHVTTIAGPVFTSLKAYTCSIAGVFWGTVLLDEKLTTATIFAFVTVLAGIYLVEPRNSAAIDAK